MIADNLLSIARALKKHGHQPRLWLEWSERATLIVRSIRQPRDAREIERAITKFADVPHRGLIVTASALSAIYGDRIIALAVGYKLPTIYYRSYFVTGGGLLSYGYDFLEQYRLAAGYVDRIPRGEKPADLPVQAPSKYELAINLRTARALGLDVPPTLLARADQAIE